MGKTDRKAQKAKARQEALRKQKAQILAQPRVVRQNPGLLDALSTRHPLVGYYVNTDWQKARMANVIVVREAADGQVVGMFLVDTMWRGLKDVFGRSGEADALQGLREATPDMPPPVPLDAATAVNLIRGGIAWAQRWRYPLPAHWELWLRLVDPGPPDGPDLRVFGENGVRPQFLGTPEEVARYEGPGRGVTLAPPRESDTLDAAEDERAAAAGLVLPGREPPRAPSPGLWRRLAQLWLPAGSAASSASEEKGEPEEEDQG